jgi:hypothetical protein
MKVLSICYKDKKGGFNKRLYSLYDLLAKNDHKLFYISTECLPISQGKIVPIILKVPFADKENALFWFCFFVRSMITSYRIIAQERINTIFSFGPFYTAICILPIVIKKIPAVSFVRADNMKHSANPLRNIFFFIFDYFGLKMSTKVIVVNSTLKEIYSRRYRIPLGRIDVQQNNIEKQYLFSDIEKTDIRKSLGITPSEFLISTSGVFNEGKNFSLLIRSMKHLKQKRLK